MQWQLCTCRVASRVIFYNSLVTSILIFYNSLVTSILIFYNSLVTSILIFYNSLVTSILIFYNSLVTSILITAQTLLLRDTHSYVFTFCDGSRKAVCSLINITCAICRPLGLPHH